MNRSNIPSASLLAVLLCIAASLSWSADYPIVHRAKSMNVEFAYTAAAEADAKKAGMGLQDAINKVNPFLFLTLLQAAKGGEAFQGYIVNRVHHAEGNAVDVIAVVSNNRVVPVSDKQNPVIKVLLDNLKNAKLFAGDPGALDVAPAQNNAIKVSLRKK